MVIMDAIVAIEVMEGHWMTLISKSFRFYFDEHTSSKYSILTLSHMQYLICYKCLLGILIS